MNVWVGGWMARYRWVRPSLELFQILATWYSTSSANLIWLLEILLSCFSQISALNPGRGGGVCQDLEGGRTNGTSPPAPFSI